MTHHPMPQYGIYNPPARNTHSSMAVAALVLGIIGVVFGLIPLTFFVALACGVLAIVFGALGRYHTKAKWGLALGIVAVALGIWGATIVNKASNDLQNYGNQYTEYQNCLATANTAEAIDACGVYLN